MVTAQYFFVLFRFRRKNTKTAVGVAVQRKTSVPGRKRILLGRHLEQNAMRVAQQHKQDQNPPTTLPVSSAPLQPVLGIGGSSAPPKPRTTATSMHLQKQVK